MFKNFVKISLRNLGKYKSYSFINIVGLAIGMAVCLLIFLFVQDELSYDRFHKNADHIYRVVGDLNTGKISPESAATGPPLAPAMLVEMPSVLDAVRIAHKRDVLVQSDSRRFYENRVGYADASMFNVFSFPLITGDAATVLTARYSIVISEAVAVKYFGTENPIGKILTLDNEFEYKITGVMQDMPSNSHFRFDFLASFESLRESYGNMYDCWWCKMAYTYILLPEGVKPFEIENQFPAFIEKHLGPQGETGMRLRLQRLTAIHLGSDLMWELEPGGEPAYLSILATVGFLILLVSCINYVNLIIARSSQRAKEICLRKVVGAKKTQLIGQFFGESIMMTFLALPITITLVELFLPKFNALSAKTLYISYTGNGSVWIGLAGIVFLVGIMAGCYPAMLLSRFHPTKVMKGVLIFKTHDGTFRRILIILQFAFSVLLIITTAVIFDQLDLIRTRKLGFNKENVVTIPVRDAAVYQNYEPFKNELLTNSRIKSISAASRVPPESPDELEVWPEDQKDSGRQKMNIVTIHYDFFKTLGIEYLEGRTFSGDFGSDAKEGFVLNESAVRTLGWKSAVGQRLGVAWKNKQGCVIGVVKDFHFESLYQKIEPTVFFMEPYYNHILVRLQTENVAETITFIKEKWQVLFPELPFEYNFLGERFDKLYQKEEKLGELFGYFSFLAIFIASLGLFGLATFATEQRTKEVGIRKVLGASVTGVVALLSKDFVKLVLLANVIAWPVAWWAMNKWLQNFAYRIDIDWWVFLLAGGLALLIALLTVSAQAIRAALANPVDSLRYE
ncbi:MAG: ABC transporter permease [bacterium]